MDAYTQPCSRKTRVRVPLGAKLVIIISSFLVFSLGAISVLVSILVSADVRISAEDHNFTLNRRVASGVETFFGTVLSNTRTFLDLGSASDGRDEALFFEKNPYIAAVLSESPEQAGRVSAFINPGFTFAGGTSPSGGVFLEASETALERAAGGETFVLNGGSRFSVPLLIMFFPWADSGGAVVFLDGEKPFQDFRSKNSETLSFLVNESGDVLVYPEPGHGTDNQANQGLVKTALERGDRNFQTVYTDKGIEYLGAYQRLSGTGTVLVTRIPAAAVLRGTRTVVRRNAFVSAAVLALSILFISLFSRTISRPIKALAAASSAMEDGNYRFSLRYRSRDEIGLLTSTFIGMGHGLENFEKFTNKTIVRLARQGALTRTGTARTVAIAFILIRDFGVLSGRFTASGLVTFVNAFLSRIVPCITCTGGIVDKFLTQDGVVVMALWGETGEDGGSPRQHALACVRSALMARAVICNWNAERAAYYLRKKGTGKGFSPVKMGCGINIGEAIAGQIGSEERMEYTVIGDTVNLAARMEGPNDLFDTDILITEHTRKILGASLVTEEMGSLELKGKEKPLRVFSVVNMEDRGEAEKIIADLDSLRRTDALINRRCAGPLGPGTMADVRKTWRLYADTAILSRKGGRGRG
ncbi:MAG: HAMP domain-containing protein [Spirochaetaceae bacterium]|jgi:adenylate cyclase|nr:HAMP domain-containing protein [Spirochaetaceae bacterium]